jgi:hypothetical protein
MTPMRTSTTGLPPKLEDVRLNTPRARFAGQSSPPTGAHAVLLQCGAGDGTGDVEGHIGRRRRKMAHSLQIPAHRHDVQPKDSHDTGVHVDDWVTAQREGARPDALHARIAGRSSLSMSAPPAQHTVN